MYSPEFIEYLKEVENDKLALKGTNMRHKSPEGGNDTIGFGHKLTDEEVKTGKVYGIPIDKMTVEQAEQVMRLDLDKKNQLLKQKLGRQFETLPPKNKEMLLDFAYNLGVEGLINKFPEFTFGVLTDNMDKVEEEHKRFFTDEEGNKKELARNKKFKEVFLQPTEEPVELSDAEMRNMVMKNFQGSF